MTDYKNITLDITDGLATITFATPQVRNALDLDSLRETLDAFYVVEGTADVGAILLTGEGEHAFCAGINLREVPLEEGRETTEQHFRYKAMLWHQLTHKVVRIRLPVLAAVNGTAAGGGFGLVLLADMAVAVDSARFLCSWQVNGVANDGATSYSLVKIVGFRRAQELMLTNRTLGAAEALDWGIVNRVYPREVFREHAQHIAQQLADGPTHLQWMAKERFHMGWRQSIEECTEYEIQNIMDSLKYPYFTQQMERFQRREGKNDELTVDLP